MNSENLARDTNVDAKFAPGGEKELSLSMETRSCGEVIILRGQGRIVFREKAAALARRVGELLESRKPLVLDLSCVETIDSAGPGELVVLLVLLHMWAEGNSHPIKLANLTPRVRHLLEITNLVSVFQIYPSVDGAVSSLGPQ
jgi:anti-anti-sigma factor